MEVERKLISIHTDNYKHVYGLSYGSITKPYYETLENIKSLLVDNEGVYEHFEDKVVSLTLENYDKDNSDEPGETIEVTKVEIVLVDNKIKEGEKTQLLVAVCPGIASDRRVTFTSECDEIATVDQCGKITGVKAGTTYIVGTSTNKKVGKAEITVVAKPVEVETVTVNLGKKTLIEGEKTTASVEITPSNAADKKVTYSSKCDKIAKVDPKTGEITAIAKGTTQIVATAANEVTGEAEIIVEAKPVTVTKVTLSLGQDSIQEEETTEVSAVVEPSGAEESEVTYSSEDQRIATVEGTTVTAVKRGTTNIIGRTANGTVGKIKITVTPKPVEVSSVTISFDQDTLTVDETTTARAQVEPAGAQNKEVTFSSESDLIATVDPSTGLVTAIGQGSTNIIGRTSNGTEGRKQITVTPKPVPVSSVTVSLLQPTLTEGETTTASADVQPSEAQDKEVTYSSENELVATVDPSSGEILAIGEGTTNIVGRTSNGTEGKASITVNPAVPS